MTMNQPKEHRFFWKTVLGIFKIALHLRNQDVFMWQSLDILTVFNTLTLHQIFWITRTFSKKLEYRFLVLRLKTHNFHTKLPCLKPMLRQIECTKWISIFIHFVSARVLLFEGAFYLWVSLINPSNCFTGTYLKPSQDLRWRSFWYY